MDSNMIGDLTKFQSLDTSNSNLGGTPGVRDGRGGNRFGRVATPFAEPQGVPPKVLVIGGKLLMVPQLDAVWQPGVSGPVGPFRALILTKHYLGSVLLPSNSSRPRKAKLG